jgi:ATP-dependent exoDNAse (exonuclease V) alpha subunit
MALRGEDGEKVEVVAPVAAFGADAKDAAELPGHPFDFGWCITCHKSQGSEFDSVLVIDEGQVFGRESRRWRYTAITRAGERVVVAK